MSRRTSSRKIGWLSSSDVSEVGKSVEIEQEDEDRPDIEQFFNNLKKFQLEDLENYRRSEECEVTEVSEPRYTLLEDFSDSLESDSYIDFEERKPESHDEFFKYVEEYPSFSYIPQQYQPDDEYRNSIEEEILSYETLPIESASESCWEEPSEKEETSEFNFECYDDKYFEDDEEQKLVQENDDDDNDVEWNTPVILFDHQPKYTTNLHLPKYTTNLHFDVGLFVDEILDRIEKIEESTSITVKEEEYSTTEEESKLDKRALYNELSKKVEDFEEENFLRTFVNRVTVEHCRRAGRFRYISIISKIRNDVDNFRKYMEGLERLDHLLGVEDSYRKRITYKIQELIDIANFEEKFLDDELEGFVQMIKTALKCNIKPYLKEVCDECLQQIMNMWDKIREVRFEMIKKNLQLNYDIAAHPINTSMISEYETLQNLIKALKAKIEDRNYSLRKHYEAFRNTLHIKLHSGLAKEMKITKVRIQSTHLKELMERKNVYRKQLYDLKIQREKLRKNMYELSSSCGLLMSPILLRDYDETVENIKLKRKNLTVFRKTKEDIDAILDILESGKHFPEVVNKLRLLENSVQQIIGKEKKIY